jgi:hypothetical protein
MNVANYTLSELMAIVELEDLEPQDIIENTNYYIRKYKSKNPQMAVFFKEIQKNLFFKIIIADNKLLLAK